MVGKRWHIVVLAALLLALGACAPKTTTTPAPAPIAPAAAPAAPAPAARTVTPEEAAWAKVVEAAKKEGKLTAYDYFLVGDLGFELSKAFEERYGIKVEVITGRGAEFLERLKTEKRIGRMVADVVSSAATQALAMKVDGLAEITANQLPVLRETGVWTVDPKVLDPEGRVLGFYIGNNNPYINTKLVKPDDIPTTLTDLLSPRWTGKAIALDPSLGGGIHQVFVPLLNRGIIDMAYLKALGDQKLIFDVSGPGATARLARGEAPLLLPIVEANTWALAQAGAPIQAVALDYTVATISALVGVKDAPHPNAALVWLNWRLSEEGQRLFAKRAGLVVVRKDVPDSRPPSLKAEAKKLIVVTAKDMEDSERLFREKAWVPLFKR